MIVSRIKREEYNNIMDTSVGVVGYGNFGKLVVKYLSKFFKIFIFDYKKIEVSNFPSNIYLAKSLLEIAKCQYIILSIPISSFSSVVEYISTELRAGTTVIDVASVKCIPYRIFKKILPDYVDFLCTHPLFGPQSSANGIAGKKIAVVPGTCKRYDEIVKFLIDELNLKIMEVTPEEHDIEMATVQGISHFIGRALKETLPKYEFKLSTLTYDHLVNAMKIIEQDSDELFYTIESANPFAEAARKRLLERLLELDREISAWKLNI